MKEREKIARVLADASSTLLKVASERDGALARNAELEAKLAHATTRLEAEKLAAEMHGKGLRTDVDFGELVSDLEKEASAGRLPVIQEAVKMAAPNMSNGFQIDHDEARGTATGSDFERFIVGEVG